MAAKSNITAVHFTLIFFVMATLILGVMAYMNYGDLQTVSAQLEEAQRNVQQREQAFRELDDQIKDLKQVAGHVLDRVGSLDDTSDPNTVIAAIVDDLKNFGGGAAQSTVSATLNELRTQLNNAMAERDKVEGELQQVKAEVLSLRALYQQDVDKHEAFANQQQAMYNQAIQNHQEDLNAKDQRIAQLDDQVKQLTKEKLDMESSHRNEVKGLRQEIADLERINDAIQEKHDAANQVSFERPDGLVTLVDHISNKVWINLGEVDLLPKRTTFSVYTKAHNGVARGPEDIKGAIEITKIIGPHMAEGRILDEDLSRPMAKGDPIYTPLWSPGRPAKFALVGVVDIDGDGKSDRKLLHDLIAAAGSEVSAEVDDAGEYNGKAIDVDTKFLIIGEIPSPVVGEVDVKNEIARKIGKHHSDFIDQARKAAVRRISLGDFLEYMGYTPKRRVWRPGEEQPFTLKAGAHSTAVNESVGNRASSGTVSRVFTNRKDLKQDSSSGQTSKAFGGGY